MPKKLFIRKVRTITDSYELVETTSTSVRYVDDDKGINSVASLPIKPATVEVLEPWRTASTVEEMIYHRGEGIA